MMGSRTVSPRRSWSGHLAAARQRRLVPFGSSGHSQTGAESITRSHSEPGQVESPLGSGHGHSAWPA